MLTSATNPNTSCHQQLQPVTTKTAAVESDAEKSQDRFLKLLVAQLNNQDPMNPMDNAQMTSQMAQINTVTGIQQLNDTMKSMATQFSAMQMLQGASMVGRDVLIEGNSLSITNGVGKRRHRPRWRGQPGHGADPQRRRPAARHPEPGRPGCRPARL